MLLKTRREFTLCFFLFVPLGMAGYCADVKTADSPVHNTKSHNKNQSKPDAARKGGQPAPQSVAGGLSSAEQLTRLLVDGRRAFRDGEILTAQSYFRDALKLDKDNAEAQKYLREIEQKATGAKFSPDGMSAQIPAGSAGKAQRVDVVGTVNAVKANETPATLTQKFDSGERASVSGSVSMTMDGGNSFSRPVSVSVSLDGKQDTPAKPAEVAAEEKPTVAAKQDAPAPEAVKAGQDALDRLGLLAKRVNTKSPTSAKDLVAEASLAVNDAAKEVASANAPSPSTAAKLTLEADKAEAAEKAKAEKAAAEKAAKEKAEAEKKAAEEKAAAEKAKAEELARVKAEAEKAEREEADRLLAQKKAEEERLAAEAAKKAEEERKAAEAAKKAEEKRQAAEAAKKAEEERKAAEAAKKAEEKHLAAEAAKKAEEERKAAEAKKAEEARKAEEAKKLAAAEKEAREAAQKAEREKKIAQAAEDRKQFDKASTSTNDGIKLYNAGKYAEAKKKFEEALQADPDYRDAKSYMVRTERKLESASSSKTTGPVLNLDQLNDELKQVAQASTEAKKEGAAEPGAEDDSKAKGDATADASATPAEGAAAESTDPIVRADKLVREARTQLAEGNRDRALELARQAAELDPKNVDATALSSDLANDATKALPSATPVPATASAEVNVASDAATESTSLDVATSVAVSPPVIGMGPSGVGSLLTEGRSKFESGQLREALTTFQAVLEKDPDNAEAKRYINKIEVARSGEGPMALPSAVPGGIATAQTAQDAEAAFQQGLVAYQAGRLDVAVQHWNFSLTLDPNHPRSVQYLEQTRGEYEAWVQQHQYNAIELQKEVASTNKLETGVTYDSSGQKTLVEFLQAMSLITDINFYVADGVDPDLRVTARFSETPLQDALDIVLLPVGLKWHRTGDVVSVTTDLHNKFYNLTPDQVQRLKPLLENRTLQRYLYGPEGLPPMRNVELLLDDRENLLIVTDSAENLSKIEAFLKDLQVDAPQQLVFKNWKIRPEEGNRIKALVEAIVKVNSDAAWDLDRRVVVDGDDLIVKDTAENVAKIEQLLLDKNFLTKLQDQTLGVQSYSLIPREPIGPENVEQARDMAQSIVTVVKTILYSQSGEEAAAAEGRRFWYDPNTLQLTITDFPDNLSIVSDYLKSLPTLSSSEQKSEIIWLKHQTAPEMKGLLEQVLGITGGVSTGSASGNSVTKTLRTEGELVFGDLRIRVKEIRGASKGSGANATQNQRTATLIVRTATNSQDLTLDEFDTEFVDEYEITAEEIRPSGMDDGEGSIRLRVAISPGAVAGGGFGAVPGVGGALPGAIGIPGAMPGVSMAGIVGGSLREELTIVIEAVPNMNALLIRYTNPADLDEVRSWLKQLDVPVMQVSIETKLVEVNETRAKEFMPEFNMANIGHGSPDFSNSTNLFDFAKNDALGELGRSPFDPFPEDPFNSGLLKGTSVFNLVTGGESPISFTLRALESEGVVNLTNGPTVTVENGQTADFQISRDFGLVGETLGQNSENTRVPRINHVNMSVTPQITQGGEIRLEITDLQLNDFGNQIMNIWPITIGGESRTSLGVNGPAIGGVLANETGWGVIPPPPINSTLGNVPYEVRRRQLSTVARVKNHGTIVLGGWMGERSRTNDSGVPILRNLPYVGKLLFGRTSDKIDRTNLLIFLTCHLIDP